jgi:hypothetical protein
LGSIGIGLLALGLCGNERWLGARRELEEGHAGSGQGGFHRWSVVGVTTVLVRGAKTDPHGWALVVEAGQGFGGVAGGGVVVPWEIEPWVSSVDQSGGPQGDGEHEHEVAVPVGGGLEMLLVG